MTIGELQYLITVNDKTDDGVRKSEGKIKKAEKQLTAYGIARAQMVMDFAKKAATSAVNAFKGTVKSAVSAYADYEQLVGGVETLFKGSADKVQKYAAQAYKTVGISANEYMENVTSFSASLLQSLEGDTSKAADIADMAMQDMADNANKMGSNMESIQNAYQGFAKQNYTMLDNLKLGYGGTKSEMERLLQDAEKLTKKKYDISNLSDVYEAIHAIQEEMGITGTTALEAEKTISGSINMTKAAWKDLLTAIGSGRDVKKATKNFTNSFKQTIKNIIPVVKTSIKGIFEAFKEALPDIKLAIKDIWNSFKSELPKNNIFAKVQEKIEGLMGFFELLTDLITNFPETMKTLESSDSPWLKGFAKLIELANLLITKINEGVGETGSLFFGTVQGIGAFITEALTQFSEWLKADGGKNVKLLAGTISDFVVALASAITQAAGPIVEALVSILNDPAFQAAIWSLLETFLEMLGKLFTEGPDAMKAGIAAYLGVKGYKVGKAVGLFGKGAGTAEAGAAGTGGLSKIGTGLKAFASTTLGHSMIVGGLGTLGAAAAFYGIAELVNGANAKANRAREVSTDVHRLDNLGTGRGINDIPQNLSNAMNGAMKDKRLVLQETVRALLGSAGGDVGVYSQLKFLGHNLNNDIFSAFTYKNNDGETRNKLLDMLDMNGDYTPAAAALVLRSAGIKPQDSRLGAYSDAYQAALMFLDNNWIDMKKNGGFTEGLGIINDYFMHSGQFNENGEWTIPGLEEDLAAQQQAAEAMNNATNVMKLLPTETGSAVADAMSHGLNISFGLFKQAKGNWTVPYDNYPSLLHRDEMVLTKSQARRYREGQTGGGLDGDMLAAAVEAAMSRVYVMMSGEKVGDLTTRRIKKNLNASSYARMRALGG